MHGDLSGGIVQVHNQIGVAVEHFQSVLGPGFNHKLNRAHPKGVLVIGSYAGLTQRQQDSFNQFRHGLHNLTVITFDELLRRLKLMYQPNQLDREPAPASEPRDLDEGPF